LLLEAASSEGGEVVRRVGLIGGPTVPRYRCLSGDAGTITRARPPVPRSLRSWIFAG